MPDLSFPKRLHLRRPAEFDRVFAARCAVRNRRLTLFAVSNGLDFPRLGLSVSRKHGPAVVRNQIKRLLREAFRLTQANWPIGIDFVVVPQDFPGSTLAELIELLVVEARQVARKLERRSLSQESDESVVPRGKSAKTPTQKKRGRRGK